ncbi:hypothetical protein [Aquabacter spiritensis]|uniref:Uncharacterized protein n=1 Tax=Aquabacter spiritensis TaxID=933073 RepID=A0A4R3LQ34_9HYPH|nr:hypothetical protein [Aquabacter spiritensis]TCT02654.1 hypothetical protein EDC64_11289 [Aquabacter spiritensis]
MQDQDERREEREFRQPGATGAPGEPVKPAPQARQGVYSGRIMTILLAGIVLVIIGFAMSYLGAV